MILKFCQLIEYQIRRIFMEKTCTKYAPKVISRLRFNFGK